MPALSARLGWDREKQQFRSRTRKFADEIFDKVKREYLEPLGHGPVVCGKPFQENRVSS